MYFELIKLSYTADVIEFNIYLILERFSVFRVPDFFGLRTKNRDEQGDSYEGYLLAAFFSVQLTFKGPSSLSVRGR